MPNFNECEFFFLKAISVTVQCGLTQLSAVFIVIIQFKNLTRQIHRIFPVSIYNIGIGMIVYRKKSKIPKGRTEIVKAEDIHPKACITNNYV